MEFIPYRVSHQELKILRLDLVHRRLAFQAAQQRPLSWPNLYVGTGLGSVDKRKDKEAHSEI